VADFLVIRFPRTRFLQRSATAAGASSRWWSVNRCSISSKRIGRMRAVWDGAYLLQSTSPCVAAIGATSLFSPETAATEH